MNNIAAGMALEAIKARINGEWDNKVLMTFGPLFINTLDDILMIIEQTLKEDIK